MIQKWAKLFSLVTLRRGEEYFRQGRVTSLKELSPGCYSALVVGSTAYHVTVRCGSRPIMHCTCPVSSRDMRPCKHEAAVLFAVESAKDTQDSPKPPVRNAPRVMLFREESTGVTPENDSFTVSVPYFDLRKTLGGVTVSAEYSMLADEMIRRGQAGTPDIWVMETYYSERILRAAVTFDLPEKHGSAFTVSLQARRRRVPQIICDSRMRKYPCMSPDPEKGELCPHCIAALRLIVRELDSGTQSAGYSDSAGQSLIRHFYSSSPSASLRQVQKSLPIRVSPMLDTSSFALPALLFRVGSRSLLQCKDLGAFADAFHTGGKYDLSAKEALDFSLQPVEEASQPFLDLLVKWVDNDRALSAMRPGGGAKGDPMLLPLYGERLDDFFDLCRGAPVPQRGVGKAPVNLVEKSVLPSVTLTPVLEDGLLIGVRGEGEAPECIIGSKYAYMLDKIGNELARMDLQPYREWKKRFPGLTGQFSFTVGREALPDFYRSVVPYLREHAKLNENDAERVSSWLPPEGEVTFFLDADNDRITCAVSAAYGEREWKLYPHEKAAEPWRDTVLEEGALNAAQALFPETDPELRLLYHARDDDFICSLMSGGADGLEQWGRVMASDRFSAIRIRRRFSVQAGVRLENDLLTLSVTCPDLSETDLKEILQACVAKRRWHRLRSGEYVDLESESVEELRRLMEAAHTDIRSFVSGRMHIPAYRALFLDAMMREHEGIQAARDAAFRQLIRSFRTVSESDFDVPGSLAGVLRPYQATGFKWLMTLTSAGFGGILADDMGLGKTIQMISCLKYRRDHTPDGERLPSLIVCPASLVYNWQAEFERFAPDMRVLPVTGTAAQRKELVSLAADNDVLVTSYDLLKRDADLYAGIRFDFHVLDEAQYIKTASSVAARSVKAVPSAHRFALTGTPIENSLSELWSIFDFLMPGFLYDYTSFRAQIETPAVRDPDSGAMEKLKKMTSPFILRRLKKDVLQELPDKMEETRTVVMSRRQGELYSAQVHHLKELLENDDGEPFARKRFRLLAEITRLRQICCDPSLFAEGYDGESCKREALMDLLAEASAGGHKALVFSQFTSMLDLIAGDLKKSGTPFYMLTGATPKEERTRMAGEFNHNGVPVFLISLKAGGTGLNLTGADIVVHYDPWWNAAATSQATDRAHRIGQEKTVTVFKLICRDTIEEKILRLQEKKQDLAEEILSGEGAAFSSMTREELLALLDAE